MYDYWFNQAVKDVMHPYLEIDADNDEEGYKDGLELALEFRDDTFTAGLRAGYSEAKEYIGKYVRQGLRQAGIE